MPADEGSAKEERRERNIERSCIHVKDIYRVLKIKDIYRVLKKSEPIEYKMKEMGFHSILLCHRMAIKYTSEKLQLSIELNVLES